MLDQKIASEVIDHALHHGADFAELFIEHHQTHHVEMSSSKVESIGSGIEFGIGVRLFFGFKVLYGYTNEPTKTELLRIVSTLIANEQRQRTTPSHAFGKAPHLNHHPVQASLKQGSQVDSKVAFLLAADSAARAEHDTIAQVQGRILQREQQIEIFNSEGVHAADTRHYSRIALTAIAKDGDLQSTGSESPGAFNGWSFHQAFDPRQLGQDIANQALVKLHADACPSGEMPVVIGNGFGGVIFHEACGHLLETTSVAKKASVFHDQLNEMIASPVVSAVDDGTDPYAWGSINIDDEGMPTQRTQLIKDGRLTSFMVDKMGGLKTGYAPTGSGRRESYKFAPTSRMRNTYIEPGDTSLDDMISSVDKGIYAKKMGGGSVQPGTGEFNFAVQEAYLIEEGKITKPLKTATLISTGPKVLKEISMVGTDLALAAGMCGSVSGAVPTSVGQPALKVDNILVGGNKG
ncbi:TldD/PmbA family protein [Thaumasiovibrio subtropicus]|uniref:TldD/PmbA family protein n=1 Tax=Thaumasiovibrio subtropicus TaxID=1891207 RepID=UPI000B352ACA|nr:TldD/PmbA family protein [Thaumasiovibrio subtropicus]